MTPDEGQAHGLDPEAEAEVDFARYARLLVERWWLLAAGLVIGAVIGYGISLGGSHAYKASATVYLGQPYSPNGGSPLQTLQTNPSAVDGIVSSDLVLLTVANACDVKASQFANGVTASPVQGALTRNGQNPVVQITVQSAKPKVASCAANGLAHKVVDKVSGYADRKVRNLKRQIAADQQSINTIKAGIASAEVSTTDKLLFQLQLRTLQSDLINATQLLAQAQQVEVPEVLSGATSQRLTARSRRNTVVVSALIGLVLGVLAALLWDRVVPRLASRNGE
jgi:capsular polysaccharide biosynthesis protein